MVAAVEEALAELADGAPGEAVQFSEDADGGAFVWIDAVPLGASFSPARSWIAFHITSLYPEADVYPHFISADVVHVAGGPEGATPQGLPPAMARGVFVVLGEDGVPAIQISRSSPRRDSETDSALQKLLRVIAWLEKQ
jgi:hypothetical protein